MTGDANLWMALVSLVPDVEASDVSSAIDMLMSISRLDRQLVGLARP